MQVIGITGTIGAGKGVIVDYLKQKKDFTHYSVRDYLIEELNNRNLVVNRDTMTMIANDLRESHSPSYIIEQLYVKAMADGHNAVIESIRNPFEAKELQKVRGFRLIGVDAEPWIRYNRIVDRNSETDNVSFRTFCENEEREMKSNDPYHQNISACLKMTDIIFHNNESIDELYAQLDEYFKDYS